MQRCHPSSAAAPAEFDFGVRLPARTDFGIAVVGAGAIVNAAHLPAYERYGFRVVGITDVRPERAEATAERFGLTSVYAGLDDLLADPTVAIVDVAVPPQAQPA